MRPGQFVTHGGRVLSVTAHGANRQVARERAYRAANSIDFPGCVRRSDIALNDTGDPT
jgi:phosphoribosylamine--glycine ligase